MVYPNVYFENLWASPAKLNAETNQADAGQQRTHIPAVFTETNATDATSLKHFFAPSLGDPGQSFWKPWGSDGINKDKLRVSTVTDLLKGFVSGGSNSESLISLQSWGKS